MKHYLISYFGKITQGMVLYSTDDTYFNPANFIDYCEKRTADTNIVINNFIPISKNHYQYLIFQAKIKKEIPKGK